MLTNALSVCVLAAVLPPAPPPSAEDILAAVAENSAMSHQAEYSGWRRYSIRNLRFNKSAAAKVRITSEPGRGKQFTISERSGSSKLLSVIESLLSFEANASRSGNAGGHQIGPSNYLVSLRGSEMVSGRDCWVLALTPKSKSKYLVNGTAWVDKNTHGLARLDGTTAATVSAWVGAPHVLEDFAPVGGIWLPVRTQSKSNSLLLGESVLEIKYMNYDVRFPGKR